MPGWQPVKATQDGGNADGDRRTSQHAAEHFGPNSRGTQHGRPSQVSRAGFATVLQLIDENLARPVFARQAERSR
jgi:hypothetical protein